MKFLGRRVISYDMMAPFIVPEFCNEYELEVKYLWGNRSTTVMNLFKYWSKISLQWAILFQRGSYDHCVGDEGIFSFE